MTLSKQGILADIFWHEIKNHAPNVELNAFVVMPNHIHGILILKNQPKNRDSKNKRDGADGRNNENQRGSDGGNNNTNRDVINKRGVETRHALSLRANDHSNKKTTNDHPTNQTDADSIKKIVQTRHALSPASENTTQSHGQKRFQNQGKNTVSSILGGYKAAVTKHANRLGLEFDWQARFDDRIIRSDKSYKRIQNYIWNNPENWKGDCFFRN